MIVEYKGKQLTKTQLTDDVMNAALEREEIINMPVAIAKDACYQYLGHSAVWEEEFAAFEAELRREPDFEVLKNTTIGTNTYSNPWLSRQ